MGHPVRMELSSNSQSNWLVNYYFILRHPIFGTNHSASHEIGWAIVFIWNHCILGAIQLSTLKKKKIKDQLVNIFDAAIRCCVPQDTLLPFSRYLNLKEKLLQCFPYWFDCQWQATYLKLFKCSISFVFLLLWQQKTDLSIQIILC